VVGDAVAPFGRPLRVTLPPAVGVGSTVAVSVAYSTTPAASALQWLTPDQTAGKAHPYLFTQCQAIHARTMVPCQDAPLVKTTYDAAVTVPAPLVALMSAVPVGDPVDAPGGGGGRTFSFRQAVPIPSYLIALAVGDIVGRDIGPRTRVYAEPAVIDAAAWEFAGTEDFVAAGEALLGPYVWGRYDVLVMPPSFPYGGMENPCLSFLTPTLLAGDRSAVTVVCHEAAHSWTGNLVTNATWESFWLNEGFTVLVERKILAALKGRAAAEFDALSGSHALSEAVGKFMARGEGAFTQLVPNLDGVDPDDAFSSVPYEKGFSLLYYLETVVGAAPFAAFLHDYIQTFKFKSLTAADFRAYFCTYFAEGRHALPRVSHAGAPVHTGATGGHDPADIPALAGPHVGGPPPAGADADAAAAAAAAAIDVSAVDWDTWFFGTGPPPVANAYDAPERARVDAHADAWVADAAAAGAATAGATAGWAAPQWVAFLQRLVAVSGRLAASAPPATIAPDVLAAIDAAHGLSASGNAEIKLLWNTLALRSGVPGAVPATAAFLAAQGRMKYVRPLFCELLRTVAGRQVALDLFATHKDSYHPICAKVRRAEE
jgi:leukotriene-A4 hydrolase